MILEAEAVEWKPADLAGVRAMARVTDLENIMGCVWWG